MVEADVATLIAAVFSAGARFLSDTIRRETRAILRALTRLRDRLRRARSELNGAEAQRAINAILGIIGLVVGFVTGVGEFAAGFAVVSTAVSAAIDVACGPSSTDIYGAANTSFGLLPNLMRDPPRLDSALFGGVTTFIGFLQDCSEVELAHANLSSAEDDLNEAVLLFRSYSRHVASEASTLTVAKRLADSAVRDARARAGAYREARGEYRDLERGLTDIRGI